MRQCGVLGVVALGLTACSLEVDIVARIDASADEQRESLPNDCSLLARGSHAYAFCGNARSCQEAEDSCLSIGWRLARIDDADEDAWVFTSAARELGAPQRLWLGGTDAGEEGNWRWSDGTRFSAGSVPVGSHYANWAPSFPTTSEASNCAAMTPSSSPGWIDRDCAADAAFVCEDY